MDDDGIKLTEQQKKARRNRNIAIALVLAAFALLIYAGTWAKLGANALHGVQ